MTPEITVADDTAATSYGDWPTKGSADQPQPWDLDAQGVSATERQLEPGAPDTVSPLQPREGLPMLAQGSQGPEVRRIAVALGELGYSNSISRGSIDNAYNVVDDSVLAAIEAFRRDYNVAEDPSQFPRDPQANAASHIGPWTQEAILRAAERAED